MKKNIGLIGAGEFGNFASKVLNLLKNYKLYAVADTKENQALDLVKKYNAKFYKNYHDLLSDSKVDIVLINTPNNLHCEMIMNSLKSNKRVLCEKPLGINLGEYKKISECLTKTRGILLINFLLTRSNIYKILKSYIDKNTFGRLKYVSVENMATESTIETPWYWDSEKSGGWFLTADVHFYDLLLFLTGEKVKQINSREYKKNTRTSSLYTQLNFKSFTADIFHDFTSGYERANLSARFYFENADITISGWVPIKMVINFENSTEIIEEDEDRDQIYQDLYAKNILMLTAMNHNDSKIHLDKAIASSTIALEAQKNAQIIKD